MSAKDPLKTAYLFARLREHKSRPRQKQTAQRSEGKPTKNLPRLPVDEPSQKKTAQRAINCAERKGRQFLPSFCFRFSFEREIFRSDKSFLFRTTFGVRHFFSALSGSFGHLCTSRNARVTGLALRGHQVIYAKSPTAHIRYSLVPSQYSPSTGQALAHRSRSRSGPVRGNPRRARSFGDCIITCRRPRRLATLSAQTCTKSLTQSCLALSAQSISVQLAKCKMSGKDPLKTASVAKTDRATE